jgi:anti-sigma factor RsiW
VTGAVECAGIRYLLGVYLLGAIEPAERAAVDNHLASCRECREELAGLAALPALLARVPAAGAGGLSPDETEWDAAFDPQPGTDLPRLLDRAARIRRVRRWLGMAAAAGAVVTAAGAAAAAPQVLNPAPSAVPGQIAWKTVWGRDDLTMASATVDYAPAAGGTLLEVRVGQIAAGTTCQLRVTNSRGQEAVGGSWTVAPGDPSAWYPGMASLPASGVRGFEVTAGGKTLVVIPAAPFAARAAPGPSWPG